MLGQNDILDSTMFNFQACSFINLNPEILLESLDILTSLKVYYFCAEKVTKPLKFYSALEYS